MPACLSRYNDTDDNEPTLSRAGQATGHLRDCLVAALEQHKEDWWQHLKMELAEQTDFYFRPDKAYWLISQLWTCTDIVPSSKLDWLELKQGGNYAQLTRRLKRDLDKRVGRGMEVLRALYIPSGK